MPKFYVTQEETCSRCEGQRFIQTPIWKHYSDWLNDFRVKNGRASTRNEDCDWWAERGYWENDPQEPIPPSEYACPDCDGTGVKVEKVELAEVLREKLDISITREGYNDELIAVSILFDGEEIASESTTVSTGALHA